jgi:hypothetical protein
VFTCPICNAALDHNNQHPPSVFQRFRSRWWLSWAEWRWNPGGIIVLAATTAHSFVRHGLAFGMANVAFTLTSVHMLHLRGVYHQRRLPPARVV